MALWRLILGLSTDVAWLGKQQQPSGVLIRCSVTLLWDWVLLAAHEPLSRLLFRNAWLGFWLQAR